MSETLFTPVTLWSDFDDTLPLEEEVVSEEGNVKEAYFYGRQTQKGRVKIFSRMYSPGGAEEYPVVMLFFDTGMPVDEVFVLRLVEAGYGVLCVDYCGDDGTDTFTRYPEDVDYANFCRAGRRFRYVDDTAKQTAWYEWAAVARYAVKYLRSLPQVTNVGAIGIRNGAEVLWKITPYAELACFISVCSGGWLAYRGFGKYEGAPEFDEERFRFIAGLDSQSYAPFAKCPVLFLCGANDKKCDGDRIYDTFARVNPEVYSAILFSLRGSGLLGSHCRTDMNLFLDKYLKGRSVFLSKPVGIRVGEEDGNLIVKGMYDRGGEISDCGVFYTENSEYGTRVWTRVLARPTEKNENVFFFPIETFEGVKEIFAFTYVRYSNGFSVASRIMRIPLEKQYKNTRKPTRVIYSNRDILNGFFPYRQKAKAIAGCFVEDMGTEIDYRPGYGGIYGITCGAGLITNRVSQKWYLPPENAMLSFDAYSGKDCTLHVAFLKDEEGIKTLFSCSKPLKGRGKWKNYLLTAADFKNDTGKQLSSFQGVESLIFEDGEIIFNNIVWL